MPLLELSQFAVSSIVFFPVSTSISYFSFVYVVICGFSLGLLFFCVPCCDYIVAARRASEHIVPSYFQITQNDKLSGKMKKFQLKRKHFVVYNPL